MPSARSFDDKRARIAALPSASPAEATAELRKLLGDKNGFLVGEAAQMVEKLSLPALVPDLAAAFDRLLVDPVKVDKTCVGKNRIVEALLALDAQEPDVYLKGLRHVQLEPAFGPPVDAAAGLRGLCAHALVHISYRDMLVEVAPLLADAEAVTRAEAANALASADIPAAAALLHLKALTGDAEPDVLGACYRGLLRIAPSRYLSFVADVLAERAEGPAEAAALALGESRAPGGLAILQAALSRASGRLRDGILLGIALGRSDEGTALLVSLVKDAPEPLATAAVGALALHRHDEALTARLRAIVGARASRKLAEVFEDRFTSARR